MHALIQVTQNRDLYQGGCANDFLVYKMIVRDFFTLRAGAFGHMIPERTKEIAVAFAMIRVTTATPAFRSPFA